MAALLKDQIAEESPKVKKLREKLKKKMVMFDERITSQALEKKTVEIHRWISQHAPKRTVLRSKNISLFDENQNTAKISRRIEKIMDEVKKIL